MILEVSLNFLIPWKNIFTNSIWEGVTKKSIDLEIYTALFADEKKEFFNEIELGTKQNLSGLSLKTLSSWLMGEGGYYHYNSENTPLTFHVLYILAYI